MSKKKVRRKKTFEAAADVALDVDQNEDRLAARRRQHAEQFADGDTGRVGEIRLELDWLRTQGALVDVDVVGLSMLTGTVRLSDLGFPDEHAVAALGAVITGLADAGHLPEWFLGFNRRSQSISLVLCRPQYLRAAKSLESQTRQALAKFSFKRGLEQLLGAYSWIPVTAYAAWKADFEQKQAALDVVKADLVGDMAAYADDVATGWRLVAREAYAALVKRGAVGYSEQEFTDRLVQAGLHRLPAMEQIQYGIGLTYTTPVLLAPSEVEVELARRDAIREERDRERAETYAAMAERQARADETIRRERDRTEYERRRLAAMHAAELEHARKQLSELESPFQQVMESLRSDVYETVQSVLASIRKHGHIRGKVAIQAENLVQTFRLLNVAGDDDLDMLLGRLDTALTRPGQETARDTAAIEAALTEIANETAAAARNVTRRLEASQASMILV